MTYPERLNRLARLCATANAPHLAVRRIVREALAQAHHGNVAELNRVLIARWEKRHLGEKGAA